MPSLSARGSVLSAAASWSPQGEKVQTPQLNPTQLHQSPVISPKSASEGRQLERSGSELSAGGQEVPGLHNPTSSHAPSVPHHPADTVNYLLITHRAAPLGSSAPQLAGKPSLTVF